MVCTSRSAAGDESLAQPYPKHYLDVEAKATTLSNSHSDRSATAVTARLLDDRFSCLIRIGSVPYRACKKARL